MKKLSVCASLTYFYTVEVEDDLCEVDNNGYLKNEAELYSACCDADPLTFDGVFGDIVGDICSICDDNTGEVLYNS